MKTNVSIKFNSIKEYRVIEKKLVELGYENEYLLGDVKNEIGEVMVCKDKTFNRLFFTFHIQTYNSLQEFLKD